jgi:pimeloyl-ACP methyl ester carboxylesterase
VILCTEAVGDGDPVVLLPSFSLDGRSMATAFERAFVACHARAGSVSELTRMYVDLPGTGGSPPVEPTSESVLQSVLDTVDSIVGRGPFSVAGWSYGGYLALGLLRRRPARITSAFLVCTGAKIGPADRDLSGTLPSTAEPGWLDAVPRHLHDHLRQAVGRQTPDVAVRVSDLIASNGPTDTAYLERLRETSFCLADENVATAAECPVVALAGRRDRVAGYRSLLDVLKGLPRGDLILSAGAGHYLPVEEPDLLALGIERWTT